MPSANLAGDENSQSTLWRYGGSVRVLRVDPPMEGECPRCAGVVAQPCWLGGSPAMEVVPMKTPEFFTSGDIARELRVGVMDVRHILSTRPISYLGRAGATRLYPKTAIEETRLALASIVKRRRREPATT